MTNPNCNKQSTLILNSSIPKIAWALSVPAVIAMVLYGFNSFMDALYVGRLINQNALAGVAMASTLAQVMTGFGSLIGVGAGTVVSIAIGKNDQHSLKNVVGNALFLSLVCSILIFLPLYIFAEPLIKAMGASGDVLTYGVEYLRVSLIGVFFWVYGIALNMIIRGEGRMKQAAFIMAMGLIANMLLTPLFILKFDMSVSGAAWATNIAMFIYVCLGYFFLNKKHSSFSTDLYQWHINKSIIKQTLSTGMPSLILTVLTVVQIYVVFNSIKNLGLIDENDALAFFAAAQRIMLFAMTPYFGLMRVMQPVAGINFGAKNYTKVMSAYWYFSKSGFFLTLPLWALVNIFPTYTLSLMLPNMVFTDSQIMDFRVYMLVLPFLSVVFTGMSLLPSIGKEKITSLIGLSRQLAFYVPVMIIAPMFFGVRGIYWGSTVIDIVITAWLLYAITKAFKRMKLDC